MRVCKRWTDAADIAREEIVARWGDGIFAIGKQLRDDVIVATVARIAMNSSAFDEDGLAKMTEAISVARAMFDPSRSS